MGGPGSGGARLRSGPPPDPNAFKPSGEWIDLPADGLPDQPPPWPLEGFSEREAHFWSLLWRKPQAHMWEKLGTHAEVALYVRNLCLAETRGASVQLLTLVRQMGDSLGLTVPGLLRNRWRVVGSSEAATMPMPTAAPRTSARDRLRVVKDAGQSA